MIALLDKILQSNIHEEMDKKMYSFRRLSLMQFQLFFTYYFQVENW